MEEEIKKTDLHNRLVLIAMWNVALLLVVIGEMDVSWVGAYADNVRATYIAETVIILLTALCVPVSLKLFAWVLQKKIDRASISEALRLYARWSDVRVCLLAVPVLAGLLTYYIMYSTTGLLCALIGVTASLFCIPSEKRLRRELHIENE